MNVFKIHCSQIGKIMGASKPAGGLSVTCKTFLHEWYANDREEIHSKYTDKGNWVEQELIDFMAVKLGIGMAEKNLIAKEDDYFIGTCDVDSVEMVVDVKAAWNNKTLHDKTGGAESDHIYQGHGYMRLYDKPKYVLFYGLMDTPSDVNYDIEVTYSHLPEDERWVAYSFNRDESVIESIIERVKLCREYLTNYDKLIKSKLGKLHKL